MKRTLLLSVCAQALATEGGAPQWVQLFTGSQISPNDSRAPWKLDNPAAVIAATKLPALIDYDHASVLDVGKGKDSKAAGWIVELATRGPNNEPGLWARVDWSESGAKAVASKEYRYLSPAFIHDKKTREVIRIIGAGLVNTPALSDLPALASVQQLDEGNSVDELLTKLRTALNLPDTASDDDVLQAVASMRSGVGQLCAAFGVKQLGANEVAAICAKAKATPAADPAQQKQIDDLQKEVATLSARLSGNSANEAVEKAVAAGKIAPAQKDWAVDYCTRDPIGFDTFIKNQPTIVAGRIVAGDPPAGELTAEERALCAQIGVTPELFKAEQTRLAAKGSV